MRKTFFTICVIAGMAAVFGEFSTKGKRVNNLLLENIEALAAGEGGEAWCRGSGNTLCPQTGTMVAYTLTPYKLK